jgi:hypothetical protein
MPDRLEHWRRPLRSGGTEFLFAVGRARFSGSIAPAEDLDGLQAIFERAHGVSLPEPEIRPMRGASDEKERPDA